MFYRLHTASQWGGNFSALQSHPSDDLIFLSYFPAQKSRTVDRVGLVTEP